MHIAELLGEWIGCPECGSKDVTISLSLPAAAEQRGVDPAVVHQTVTRTRENVDRA